MRRTHTRLSAIAALAFLLVPARHSAAQERRIHDAVTTIASSTSLNVAPDDTQSPRPPVTAFEYSDGYRTRAKIHKYASFATLPLFATEFALGQSLYSNPSEGKKGAHVAVGSGIIGLYGVQAATGVWNLVEARKDPATAGKKRRLVHSSPAMAAPARIELSHSPQSESGPPGTW